MGSILQGGVAKSGNYWLWKIIDSVLEQGGRDRSRYITQHEIFEKISKYEDLTHENQSETDVVDFEKDGVYFRVSSIYKEKIVFFNNYLEKASHVWTHSELNGVGEATLVSFEKVIYVVRDPRDVALSMANFSFTPYMMKYMPHYEKDVASYLNNRLEWQTRSWVRHVCSWLRVGKSENVIFVFYENLKENTASEVARIADFLNVDLDGPAIDKIVSSVSVSNMKKNNPNHVRTGSNGGWHDSLSKKQIDTVNSIAAPLLRAMGYEADGVAASPVKSFDFDMYSYQDISRFEARSKYSRRDKVRALFALLGGRRTLRDKINVILKYVAK